MGALTLRAAGSVYIDAKGACSSTHLLGRYAMRKAVAGLLAALLLAGAGQVRADDQAEMKALVTKAVQAMGGQAKLAKLRAATWKGKGTLHIDGNTAAYTEDSSSQFPDRLRFDMEIDINGMKLNQLLVVDGDKGWIKTGGATVDMPKEVRTAITDYFYALALGMMPGELADKAYKLSPLGEVKVGDKTAVGLQASRPGRRDVNLYFDKEAGLPLKIETTAGRIEDGMEVNFEFLYTEYKDMDGVKTCTKMTWKREGKTYLERELTEVTPQEKLDDGVFAKP